MKTTLRTEITVADICNGFVYNQLEGKGLFGLGGRLTIQPEYQRNYLYADSGGKREAAVKGRIYRFDEMDADHVAAWSKGGDSSAKNCEMLCTTHNLTKGNR